MSKFSLVFFLFFFVFLNLSFSARLSDSAEHYAGDSWIFA